MVLQTIGTHGFAMVFGPATIDADGFEVRQPLDTMVFQWFLMVANHWSNGGMVTIHRYGLHVQQYFYDTHAMYNVINFNLYISLLGLMIYLSL